MPCLLVVNAGSSSLKLALYRMQGETPALLVRGHVGDLQGTAPRWKVFTAAGAGAQGVMAIAAGDRYLAALHVLTEQFAGRDAAWVPDAVVHRIVHGGADYQGPLLIDDAVMAGLEALIPLAPLHQPAGMALVRACRIAFPDIAQYACFDTDFHRTLPALEYRVPLPAAWEQRGVRQYGFHGISYQRVTASLHTHEPQLAQKRVVLAHLGAGASLCALAGGQSVATTMGFSVLEGLPMGTRPGRLDAGIVLYLLQSGGLDVEAVSQLLYHESGLKALSGISDEMQVLLASEDPAAQFAIEYFCRRAAREIAGMASALGGLDVLAFTGGIGENAPAIRERIARHCAWMGLELDAARNTAQDIRLHAGSSRVACYRIETDEAACMAGQVHEILGH